MSYENNQGITPATVSRPDTPPPVHVSPRRECMTGLPVSPLRHQAQARSPSRMLCGLTKIASQEDLDEIDAEIEAANWARLRIHSPLPPVPPPPGFGSTPSLQNSPQPSPVKTIEQTDSGYLVPIQPSGPGEVMPPSESLNRLPIIVAQSPGELTPLRGILVRRSAMQMTRSMGTLNCINATDNNHCFSRIDQSNNLLSVNTGSTLNPLRSGYFTPADDRAMSPCFLNWNNQVGMHNRSHSHTSINVPLNAPSTSCTVPFEQLQPSTSHQQILPVNSEAEKSNYTVTARTTASGIIPSMRLEEPGIRNDLNLIIHTPPASPTHHQPPSPTESTKLKKKSIFNIFRRGQNENPLPNINANHTQEEMDRARLNNAEVLKHFITDCCQCIKTCPGLMYFLALHREHILRTYNAGPYTELRGTLTTVKMAELQREYSAYAFTLSVENIHQSDSCLRVTYSQGCRVNERSLLCFSMYSGFRGFKLCDREAFVVYSREDSAMEAMRNHNGLMVYQEHGIDVQMTTVARVKEVCTNQSYRAFNRPGEMEQASGSRYEDLEGRLLDEPEERIAVRRRGGNRRRGDERYLPANRNISRRKHSGRCLCCATKDLFESDF